MSNTPANSFLTSTVGTGFAPQAVVQANVPVTRQGSDGLAETVQQSESFTEPEQVVETTEQTADGVAPPVQDASGVPASEPEAQTVSAKQIASLLKDQRRLDKQKKEAEGLIAKAEALKDAFDPNGNIVDRLQKLGYNPAEIYQKMQEHAVKMLDAKPKDPMQAKLEEQEAQLKSYAQKQQEMENKLEQERTNAAHINAITNVVAPVINNNPDKYETLIAAHGSKEDAISAVYRAMWDEYCQTGRSFSAEEAADAMEAHWADQVEKSLASAKQLKKYQHHFSPAQQKALEAVLEAGQKESPITKAINNQKSIQAESFANALAAKSGNTSATSETTNKSPKTLTNNMSTTVPNVPLLVPSVAGKKDHLADFLKKKGIVQ